MERALNLHRRQPLLAGVVLFLSGVHCGYRFGAWPLAAAGAACCALAARRDGWLRWAGKAGLLLMLGWARAAWDGDGRGAEAERLKELQGRAALVCRVGPEVAVRAARGESAKYTFLAEHVRISQAGRTEPLRYLPVEVSWFGDRRAEGFCAPQPGEAWRVEGRPKIGMGRDGLLCVAVNTGEERSERLASADDGSWRVRLVQARRAAARRVTIGIEDWGVVPITMS